MVSWRFKFCFGNFLQRNDLKILKSAFVAATVRSPQKGLVEVESYDETVIKYVTAYNDNFEIIKDKFEYF